MSNEPDVHKSKTEGLNPDWVSRTLANLWCTLEQWCRSASTFPRRVRFLLCLAPQPQEDLLDFIKTSFYFPLYQETIGIIAQRGYLLVKITLLVSGGLKIQIQEEPYSFI